MGIGVSVMASGIGLAFLRPPVWTDGNDCRQEVIGRWSSFQRAVRRCTNLLVGLTGCMIFVCAFVPPQGRTWMAIWLLVFLLLITVLFLALLDALFSLVGYRQAVPEAARRSFAGREPNPQTQESTYE